MLKEILEKLKGKHRRLWRSNWNVQQLSESSLAWVNIPSKPEEKKIDERIETRPVEVFREIIGEKPNVNLAGLDRQLELVKKRMEVLRDAGVSLSDENDALAFLKARKKWEKFGILFRWEVATYSAVDALCKKYKLKEAGIQSYYKNLPMEAVEEIEKYINAYEKVTDVQPNFRLIVDDGGRETKKDPILLASSPFGKWWYILGAWDKEVEIVDDLIYKGK